MWSDSARSKVRMIPLLEISPRFSTTNHSRARSPPSLMKTTHTGGGTAGKLLVFADCLRVYSKISAWVELAWRPVKPLSSGSWVNA